jgi:cytochrome c-type biogenesis protein CcmH
VTLSRSVKRWPGWALMAVVFVGLLAVGTARDNGPSTPAERTTALAERVACPICDGESVAESRDASSQNIRNEIRRLVDEGTFSDEEILAYIDLQTDGNVLLVPRASGFDALVWVIPVAALVCAAAGLAVTFRRWRREAAADHDPSDADRALVAAALADDDDVRHDG